MATVRLWRDDEVGKDPAVKAVFDDRHIELDGDSHGPMGRELLEGLLANSGMGPSALSVLRAAASRRGSSFGTAHWVSFAATVSKRSLPKG